MNELQSSSIENTAGVHILRLLGARSVLISTLVSILLGFIFIGASIAIANIPIVPASTAISPTSTSTTKTSASPVASSTETPSHNAANPATNTVSTYLTALEIKPSSLFSWGLLLIAFGGIGFLITKNSRVNLLKIQEREERQKAEQEQKRYRREQEEREIGAKVASDPLIAEAQRWLDKIRFQQSYSSGWSGTLSLPIAVEGAVNAAVSLAQNQLSLPEIIEGYRQFLHLVSREYKVIIGIDEMDKLESDEKAQRFLNEIKALFGLEHCFYLVSVSESAMSSFERRGLPFRDVFDSSFDDIIYVDYLNFQSAQRLLRRRVIGIPIPFLCLCYCISGGLARDLIRTCRTLLERVQIAPEENSLTKLSNFLITADIKAKLRAAVIVSKNIMVEIEINQFFDTVHQVERDLDVSSLSLKSIANLWNSMEQITEQQVKSTEAIVRHDQAKKLKIEVGTYLYYAVTLIEYFASKSDLAAWKAATSSSDYDQLARIRQFFSVSPYVARTMISQFRKGQGMDVLE